MLINGMFFYVRHPIKIEDFLQHVNEMSADSDYKFSMEYEVQYPGVLVCIYSDFLAV